VTQPNGLHRADLQSITVVIVTYESAHCMPALGGSLVAFPHVIVVDNGSGDDTVAAARQLLPQTRVICNGQNLGFGAANNRAFAVADTEFVLLLNPDCTMTPDAALALVDAARRYPGASTIGPQLIDRHGRPEMGYRMRVDRWLPKGGPAEGELCVEFLSGACMLIRRSALQRIGGFDEDFFLYQEDHDLCLRLAQSCGELILCPQAQATHQSRRSSAGRHRLRAEYLRGFHHIQSKFIFERKHGAGEVDGATRARYMLAAAMEALLRACLLDRPRACRAWGRMWGAWRYVPHGL
jgi:N-acetylglucosaminyl-diphospho-decaprenol L-rhamnosyltransferase